MTLDQQRADSNRKFQILKPSFGITFFTFFGTLFGFLTQLVLASRFGTGSEMDAYLVSITIPVMVLSIFLGSLRYTFVPVFVESKTKGEEKEAWLTATNFFNLSLVVFGVLTLLGMLYSEFIIGLMAPGLAAETKSTAAVLFMIQMPTILLSGLTALLSSVYFAEKRFLRPAIANLINAIVLFFFVYLFSKPLGIQSPAWGAVLGNLFSLALLMPIVVKKFHYRFLLNLKEKGTLRILGLMMPLLIGSIFYRADNLIQRYIASSLPTGSISYLGYAFKLSQTLSFLIVSGISVVFLSHISELSSKKDTRGVKDMFTTAFHWLTFMTVPILIGQVILGSEIITILFQRGRFDELSTYHTWICLMLYSGFFYASIILSVVNPVFYAYKDTITVMKIGIMGALLQLLFSLLFVRFLFYAGLPFAYSLAQLIILVIFLMVVSRKYISLPFVDMVKALIRISCAAASAGFIAWIVKFFWLAGISPVGRTVIIIPFFGVLFLGICFLLKVKESAKLTALIMEYARRRLFSS